MIYHTVLILIATLFLRTNGFTPHVAITKRTTASRRLMPLSFSASALPDIEKMKASELRKELQSYGISTKSFFEKSELVDAVSKARAEGKKPIRDKSLDEEGTSASGPSSSKSREERIAEEIEKCKGMSVGDLKKELQIYGVNVKSFFEKSEFVGAVAEARVDGKKKSASGSGSRVEEYDPSYRDVVMQKMNVGIKSLMGNERIIDIQLGR